MRQRTLNGVLVGAVTGVFCLLAATAYTQIKEADSRIPCVSENPTVSKPANRCESCPTVPCASEQRR